MDYKGKIYQLVCSDGYYYIGSTKNELRKRYYEHKSYSQLKQGRRVYKHINNIGWENVKIVLIEELSCKDKEELTRKEYEHILRNKNDEKCLNMLIGNSFDEEYNRNYNKQYREDNKDKIKQYKETNKNLLKDYNKQYREKNKDKINEYNKQYYKQYRQLEENKEKLNQKITCECGSIISKHNINIHKKSQKHIKNCPDIS